MAGVTRDRGVIAVDDPRKHARLRALPRAPRTPTRCCSRDETVGVVLIVVATTPRLAEKARRWGKAALDSNKPTAILFTPGSLVDGARAALRAIGCPFTHRMDDALRVFRAAVDYASLANAPRERACSPHFIATIAAHAARLTRGRLTESAVKALLRDAGVATTSDVVAHDADAAVAAAERIGYPVVMQASSRTLVGSSCESCASSSATSSRKGLTSSRPAGGSRSSGVRQSPDAKEGIAAFKEKRKPKFTSR